MQEEKKTPVKVVIRPAGVLVLVGACSVLVAGIAVTRARPGLSNVGESAPIAYLAANREKADVFDKKGAMSVLDISSGKARDWVVWGPSDTVKMTRMSSGSKEIGKIEMIKPGSATLGEGKKGLTRAVSWTGGDTVVSASGAYPGIHAGANNGFRFTLPATTEERTLRVYVGAMRTGGEFSAWLSDGQRPEVKTDEVALEDGYYSRVYTIKFKAAVDKQELKVVWRNKGEGGNVSLQAATLE